MKAYKGCFRQKNSKRGMALSTAMAICIVLALLTALLVSMASLNITTTQATIGQRTGYIQAKSAIAFAESYYSQHSDEIPGKAEGETGGTALFVFKDSVIAHGADIYVTGTTSNPEIIPAATVQSLKDGAESAYLDIVNTGSILDITAYCKYGSNNMYTLTKEFNFTHDETAKANAFTGNITYKPTSDTRFLRIHVRASAAWGYEPYLYTYGAARNSVDNPGLTYIRGRSSLENKLSNDDQYPDIKFSEEWKSVGPENEQGPKGAMTYEGNGWYVYEITFPSNVDINYINAIVTRKGALRKFGGEKGATAQSWEFFGIPVPKTTGEGNGADVYITLNQSHLRDARTVSKTGSTYEWHDPHTYQSTNDASGDDELTYLFETGCHANIDEFAMFSGKWYTVYTKAANTAIMHYKRATINDDSGWSPSGFEYEGYGWYRDVSYNFSDSIDLTSGSFSYGSLDKSEILSENSYGKDIVRESFVVEGEKDGEWISEQFRTEAEANDWIVEEFGDTKAGDYVTVNARANEMKVSSAVPTTINYTSTLIKGEPDVPVPDDNTNENDGNKNDDNKEIPEPGSTKPVAAKDEELVVEQLGKSNVKLSADERTANVADWGVEGTFNKWAQDGSGTSIYENTTVAESVEGNIHVWTFEGLEPGEYQYRYVALTGTGPIDPQDEFDEGGVNYKFNVGYNAKVVLKFDRIAAREVSCDVINQSTNGQYSVIGTINNWGMQEGSTAHFYQNTTDMIDQGDNIYTLETPYLSGGQQIEFKVLRKIVAEGTLEDNHGWDNGNCWGGNGASGNYVYVVDGNPGAKYTVTITFNAGDGSITVSDPVEVSDIVNDEFYVIGDYNNWGAKNGGTAHNFESAKKDLYKLDLKRSDESFNYYSLDIGKLAAGNHEIKIFSSSSNVNPDGTIDYDTSWGALNGAAQTYHSTDTGYTFTLDNYSLVTIEFTYNKADFERSSISYTAVNAVEGHEITGAAVNVAFYNAQLTNKNDPSQKSAFEHAWTNVYYSYYSEQIGMIVDQEITGDRIKGNFWWGEVPNDADYFYFHNKPFNERGSDGYEYTDYIYNESFRNMTNPVFFPNTSTTETDGVKWMMGDNTAYRTYTLDTESKTGTGTMIHTGNMQTNYYDVPMVKLLLELIPGRDTSKKYGFSSVPWEKYVIKDKNGTQLATVHWKKVNSDGSQSLTGGVVKYQGEEYYYTEASVYNNSFLLIRNHNDNKGGVLLENHFALISGVMGVADRMENRAGAVFTSSMTYYNGEPSSHNYGGYAPNWYTYKVPASSELTINDISGVMNSESDFIIQGNSLSMNVAKASANYNYPLFIYKNTSSKDPENSLQCYTYDTYTGNVDTNKQDNVSIYLNKPSSWSDEVRVHAYSVINNDTLDAYYDYSNGDYTTFYRFEFPAGKYCFFEFFDKNEPKNRTGVLAFTGKEIDREYQILCDPEDDLGKGGTQNSLVFYCHPKTSALYGMQDARSAKILCSFGRNYKYDGTTKEFSHGKTDEDLVTEFADMFDNAYDNYFKGMPEDADPEQWEKDTAEDWKTDHSQKWKAAEANTYADAVRAANRFANAISNTRIYIGTDVSDIETGMTIENDRYLFPEGAYRDDIVKYADRWVSYLTSVYDNAMSVTNHDESHKLSDSTLIQTLNYYADELNGIIAAPEIEIGEEAAQIIVDNQVVNEKQADGTYKAKGGWNISSIGLYNLDTTTGWAKLGCQLYDTTQKEEGFYAYVFRLKNNDNSNVYPSNMFMIGTSQPDASVTGYAIEPGRRYTFHTATGKFEEDKSIYTIKVSCDVIDQNGYTAAYGAFQRNSDKDFVVYFNYDTTVKYKDGILPKEYTIYAGAYTISKSSYGRNFSTDFSDPNVYGINLFSDNAMKFFTNKSRIGLSNNITDISYKPWSETFTDIKTDKDIMFDSITVPEDPVRAQARNAGRVNFRFKNIKGKNEATGENLDNFVLNKNVELQGGIVTMAVNNLDLSNKDITIKAKTVIFRTDTVIKTNQGKYTINHGTYLYIKSDDDDADLDSVVLSMQSTGTSSDWRNHYMLVDEQLNDLGGGHYIGN